VVAPLDARSSRRVRDQRGRHRLSMMRRCSAASRVPSLTLGGSAALDPTCAPSREAVVDRAWM